MYIYITYIYTPQRISPQSAIWPLSKDFGGRLFSFWHVDWCFCFRSWNETTEMGDRWLCCASCSFLLPNMGVSKVACTFSWILKQIRSVA